MFDSINSATLSGNVGKNPELKYLQNGKAVCNFSFAVNSSTVKDGNRQKTTMWVKVEAWEAVAEKVAKFVKSGSFVIIQGPVSVRAYINKSNEPVAELTIKLRNFESIQIKDSGHNQDSAPQEEGTTSDPEVNMGDIPF